MKNWKPAFYYPEKEYQLLENETQMLTPEFNTVYHYKITSYSDEAKSVKFKLYYKNFGEENQEITYLRNSPNVFHHTLRTLFFILITLILHLFLYVAFLYLLYFACFFIHWEFNKIKFLLHKKYEQKLNKALEDMLAKSKMQSSADKHRSDESSDLNTEDSNVEDVEKEKELENKDE